MTARCKGCGACLLTCPTHAIRPHTGGAGGPLAVRADLCTGCGECIEICPADAIEDPRDKGDPVTTSDAHLTAGRWTRAERARLSGILGIIAALHIAGWSMYVYYSSNLAAAGSFTAAGVTAYVLGMRHAFDADHIAAIDDTTRLMLQRGRRSVGVGFFFAMGHSTVVLILSVVIAIAAGAATTAQLDSFREIGGAISVVVAMGFLLLVAALNALVLRGIYGLWRRMSRGELDERELEVQLLNRGLMNRMLGGRARSLIRSSWHMFPVGLLFGLGLETASEVTLLGLAAQNATHGGLPLLATLTLPLLFACGMSALDTCDSLLMTRAYSWAFRSPARKVYYNIATTAMTVVVAAFIGSVYLADIAVRYAGVGVLAPYASLADRFEYLGYGIVAVFAVSWLAAAVLWRVGRFEQRYGGRR